jgi:dynein heavy chain
MKYPFSVSDLLSSAAVLANYMENAPTRVPWQDLRYLVGEIMYGGHIANDIDRLVCNTYLAYFLRDELLDELEMFPYVDIDSTEKGVGRGGGNAATTTTSSSSNDTIIHMLTSPKLNASLERMCEHVDEHLTLDTPLAFGLHPNAEIFFASESSEQLLQSALLLGAFPEPKKNAGISATMTIADEIEANSRRKEDYDGSMESIVEGILQDVLENYRDLYLDVSDILLSNGENLTPYQTLLVQECERMNSLLRHITSSLIELELCFRGELTMSDTAQLLQECLYMNKVPRSWENMAYPSLRSLSPWLTDLERRLNQLQEWMKIQINCGHRSSSTDMPLVIWISGLFDPQSFLTTILQTAARKNAVELDKLMIATDVTKRNLDSLDAPSRDGQFIYGLSLEGARWDVSAGVMDVSLPKEMSCPMPIMNCRAVLVPTANPNTMNNFNASNVNIFECPVYRTRQRGSTYIFTAQLRTKASPSKWVVAGASLIMEIV